MKIYNTLLQLHKKFAITTIGGHFSRNCGSSFEVKSLYNVLRPMFSEIEEIWALDSFPGSLEKDAQDQNEVRSILSWLRAVSFPVKKRSEVKRFLMDRGVSAMVSQWMTTNLVRSKDGFRWRFNLDGIEEMLNDYFVQDLWNVLDYPNSETTTHLVRALKSDRWDEQSIERLERLEDGQYHTLDAGHWLHVDNPEGLLDLFETSLLPLA